MDGKEDSLRQENCQESVRGEGMWWTSVVCFPLSSAPGEGEFLGGIYPHRSRKQPEKDSSNNS